MYAKVNTAEVQLHKRFRQSWRYPSFYAKCNSLVTIPEIENILLNFWRSPKYSNNRIDKYLKELLKQMLSLIAFNGVVCYHPMRSYQTMTNLMQLRLPLYVLFVIVMQLIWIFRPAPFIPSPVSLLTKGRSRKQLCSTLCVFCLPFRSNGSLRREILQRHLKQRGGEKKH